MTELQKRLERARRERALAAARQRLVRISTAEQVSLLRADLKEARG